MTLVSEIEFTTKNIRASFENKSIALHELSRLYANYNPDVDADVFVRKAEILFPKLNCGLASLYLRSVLGGDIVRGSYGGHGHTFLMIDELVVDITADQYGGPKVYVGALRPPWSDN